MPDVPVSLVPWFDAKDNPPKDERNRHVLIAVNRENGGRVVNRLAWDVGMYGSAYDLWAEYPSPPDMNDPLGPLTVEGLRTIASLALIGAAEVWKPTEDAANRKDYDADVAEIVRLRRALDQLSQGENHE